MMHFEVACILIVAAFGFGYVYGAKREYRGRHEDSAFWDRVLGKK